jgi:phage host-nuclease inhibitor protein Gam
MREKKLKRAAETAQAPETREEAERMLARLGEIQREKTLLSTALEETLAAERTRVEAQALPLTAEAEQLTRGIQLWAEANRRSLTQDGRTKTIRLSTGEIAWRARPPSVKLRDQGAILEFLAKMGLARFIRTKTEVNREAMLAEPSVARDVPGVTISSEGEEFVVSPLTEQVAA